MAGETIAKMAALLSVDTGQFNPGIDGAIKKLEGLDGALKGVKGGDLSGIAAGIGKVAGIDLGDPFKAIVSGAKFVPGPVGAAAAAIEPLVPVIESLVKTTWGLVEAGRKSAKEQMNLSRMLNLSSRSAAGMQLAIAQAGTTLDDVRPFLTRFQRHLGEASAGSAEAQQLFRRLGLSADELARMPADQALQTLARHFRDLRDPNEKARQAMLIFGRQGADALKVLNELADLPNFERLAERWRMVLSASDVARLQAARRAELAASTQAQAARTGFTQRLGVAAAPIITVVNQAAAGLLQLLNPVFNYAMWVVGKIGNYLQAAAAFVTAAWEPWGELLGAVLDVVNEILKAFTDLDNDVDEGIISGARTLGEMLAGVRPVTQWLTDRFKELAGSVRWLVERFNELRGTVAGWVEMLDRALGLAGRLNEVARLIRGGNNQPANNPNQDAIAHRQELMADIARQVEQVMAQWRAVGGAANAAALDALRARGATEEMLERLQAEQAGLYFSQTRQGLEDQRQQLQMTTAEWTAYRAAREGVSEEAAQQLADMEAANAALRVRVALRDQARQIGMTADQWEVYRLRREGATEADLRAVRALQQQRDNLQDLNDVAARAAQTAADNLGPLDHWGERLADLNDQLIRGGLAWEDYEAAVGRATRQMIEAAGVHAPAAPQALAQGTAAALNAINASQRGEQDPQERVRLAVEQLRRTAERQRDEAAAFYQWARENGLVLAPADIE